MRDCNANKEETDKPPTPGRRRLPSSPACLPACGSSHTSKAAVLPAFSAEADLNNSRN